MPKILKGLAKRIFLTIFSALFILSTYFCIHSYYVHINSAEENMLVNLKSIANTLAVQIDASEFNMILQMFPEIDQIKAIDQHPYYQHQYEILKRTVTLNELSSPIYTLTYDSISNGFFFGISSSEKPYYRHKYDSFPQELLVNYKNGGTIPAYKDENGYWLSAFSPITENNKVIGVVVVDLPFEEFLAKAKIELFKNIAISLSMVILVSLILFRLLDKILKEDRSRRILIRQKNTELKIKNKEITSSLRYAKRIQDAILPPKSMLDDYLGNYFIYYKPRDIVAGDFYWSCKVDDIVYFACADCTGHGVPGAMVSVICSKSLDSALKQYNLKRPGEILDKVSSLVEEAFEKSELDINDGMDICLIAIDKKQNELTLAGAHNSLYQIKNSNELNQNELIEHKTDKQPIGRYSHKAPFSQKKIKFHKGETFYLFTDGYADQFGGEKGKKFLYREFKKLLVSISKLQLVDQYKKIDKAFKNWKGKEEQVDDICVVGIKL